MFCYQHSGDSAAPTCSMMRLRISLLCLLATRVALLHAVTQDVLDESVQFDPITNQTVDLPGNVTKFRFNGNPLPDPILTNRPLSLGLFVYPKFELLDVMGPLQMLSYPAFFKVTVIAKKRGRVPSTQVISINADKSFRDVRNSKFDVFMIPGGGGTFDIFNATHKDGETLSFVKKHAKAAKIVFTVCSGSAILAKTGLLDGKQATTNKFWYDRLVPFAPKVNWVRTARWVQHGKYITTSGVSAGIDGALYLVRKTYGDVYAFHDYHFAEYTPNFDSTDDPFADQSTVIPHHG